jgi:hypothetical protein
VLIASSGSHSEDPRADAKNAADLTVDSCFISKNQRGKTTFRTHATTGFVMISECADHPTAYSIGSSCFGGVNANNAKGWIVEVSVDGASWIVIDEKHHNNDLNDKNVRRRFEVLKREECRFIRLVNIGRNHYGTDALLICSFEIFGRLVCCGPKPY